MMACVTYAFVYPCMHFLRKYEVQKGFCCNVHLSVAVHRFLCFHVKADVSFEVVHY